MRGAIVSRADGSGSEFVWLPDPEPAPGEEFEVDGVRYRREGAYRPDLVIEKNDAHVGHSLPLWDPLAPHHLPNGKPYFTGKRERVEYQAKTGRTWND